MKLLSILRNGDNRFLPLLLAKVGDVLPTLANPMLQTVPDTPASMCQEIDIFDGYGSMGGMGVPSNNYLSTSSGSIPHQEFKMESPLSYDKRLENISSPNHPEGDNSPFRSPPIVQPAMDFPSMGEYGGYQDLHGPHMAHHLPSSMGNFVEGVGGGGRQTDFKQEFDGSLGLLPGAAGRSPPIQQQTNPNGYPMHQMPRSIPEYNTHLQRTSSHERGMGVGVGLDGSTFR